MEHAHFPEDSLRAAGFRVTPGRVRLLHTLEREGGPRTVGQIRRALGRNTLNEATLYRALEALAERGVIRRIDLNTGIAHFEYSPEHPHHHHAICTRCGIVEEVAACPLPETTRLKQFRSITAHSLEFFGVCRNCTTR